MKRSVYHHHDFQLAVLVEGVGKMGRESHQVLLSILGETKMRMISNERDLVTDGVWDCPCCGRHNHTVYGHALPTCSGCQASFPWERLFGAVELFRAKQFETKRNELMETLSLERQDEVVLLDPTRINKALHKADKSGLLADLREWLMLQSNRLSQPAVQAILEWQPQE